MPVSDLICDQVFKGYLDRLYLIVDSSVDDDAREEVCKAGTAVHSATESER
jgi:hypothetical protein